MNELLGEILEAHAACSVNADGLNRLERDPLRAVKHDAGNPEMEIPV